MELVPEVFARKNMLAPIALSGRILRVAQANPFDVLSIDELQQASGRMIEPHCASRGDVQRLIDRSYSGSNELQLLARAGVHRLGAALDVAVEEAPIVRMIELMLNDAIERGATDLHIEPEEDLIRLRHRIDGVLIPWETLPKPLLPAIVSRIKVMAGLDIAEQRLPQDGRISDLLSTRRVDLRISTLPTMFGEKVAIRILEKEKLVRGLEELGFSRRNLTLVHDIVTKSRGIILVTGPTGAGKTTTLYSALTYLGARERNILTVEDPVEYELPAMRQTQVRVKAGYTFAAAVRALLRQDPDVIMVGEIRDPETAQMALRAALSGVLIFSTLHTQDSAGAVPRLMDMGLEPYLLASAMVAVVAQRLVRVVCQQCKAPAHYPAETLAKVGLLPDHGIEFFRGRGCAACNHTGYRGRTGAFEILPIDKEINDMIRKRADSRLVKEAAVKVGLKTLLDDSLSKAIFGQTTLEEVLRIAYE
ncbi:MAG: type II/IV secretion system protein [Acidobacteria bacterium]|nr:type II/IV secretion system protein [Acidobacteriota bacterium]